jgi:hypothetical protein
MAFWYNIAMFVKTTKSRKYEYVQLVQSYREKGQTKHKVMLILSRLDHIVINPSFQRLALRLQELPWFWPFLGPHRCIPKSLIALAIPAVGFAKLVMAPRREVH